MKKILTLTILTSLISLNSFAKNYAGVEIQHNSLSLDTKNIATLSGDYKPNEKDYFNEKSTRPAIFIGSQLAQNVDVELIYSYLNSSKNNSNTGLFLVSSGDEISSKTQIKLHNIGLDFKPFVQFSQTKLYAIVGANYIRAEVEETYTATELLDSQKQSKNGFGYSVGAGVEYEIVKDFAVRVQAKYTKIDLSFNKLQALDKIDNIASISAGLLFKF